MARGRFAQERALFAPNVVIKVSAPVRGRQVDRINAAYNMLDIDKSGYMDRSEFLKVSGTGPGSCGGRRMSIIVTANTMQWTT